MYKIGVIDPIEGSKNEKLIQEVKFCDVEVGDCFIFEDMSFIKYNEIEGVAEDDGGFVEFSENEQVILM